jgi:hypothetical protein
MLNKHLLADRILVQKRGEIFFEKTMGFLMVPQMSFFVWSLLLFGLGFG